MPRGPLLLILGAAVACGSRAAAPPAPPSPTPTAAPTAAAPAPATAAPGLRIPVESHKLPNGLRVVLSPDPGALTVAVGVYYRIGFRIEPKGRTGFAHLFEHMMFQGSKNLGKMEFDRLIEANGGLDNGSTRFDFTNYYEVVPAGALELTLWAEADRMAGLAVTEENLANQKGVVSSEVRVNILNQPYGGFPWLDMPQIANQNWNNAHNFYGDLADIEAATLADVRSFFDTYYAPNNAVLVLAGGFDPAQALAWANKYFAAIPSRQLPSPPNLDEPRQTQEKRKTKVDPLAPRPAMAFSYHMPPRGTPEQLAMGIIRQILSEGRDSYLHESLVLRHAFTDQLGSAINELGNLYNYQGPMLFTTWFNYDNDKSADDILAAVDVEVRRLQDAPIDEDTLARGRVKMRSELYDILETFNNFGRADLLASFALFDDDPGRINAIEPALLAVSPAVIQSTAREYLRRDNRTVLLIQTKGGAK